jgi:hypothetical protein
MQATFITKGVNLYMEKQGCNILWAWNVLIVRPTKMKIFKC